MKKTKFIVAFLLVCVLSIGGAVVVFGAPYEGKYMDLYIGDATYSVPVVEGNYLFMNYNGMYYMFDSPSITKYVNNSSGGYDVNISYVSMYQKIGNTWQAVTGTATAFTLNRSLLAYGCNVDLKSPNGNTVVFQKTEVPIARVAMVLPEEIAGTARTITIVAVGCLALLVGSIILLPKLKIFLVG